MTSTLITPDADTAPGGVVAAIAMNKTKGGGGWRTSLNDWLVGDRHQPPPPEMPVKQPPRRREGPKIFLEDILANGPTPATLVIERGAAHGFTKRQITYAREQMKLIALKGTGKDRLLVLGFTS